MRPEKRFVTFCHYHFPSYTRTALYDFEGEDTDEISFFEGDLVEIIKSEGEWYRNDLASDI